MAAHRSISLRGSPSRVVRRWVAAGLVCLDDDGAELGRFLHTNARCLDEGALGEFLSRSTPRRALPSYMAALLADHGLQLPLEAALRLLLLRIQPHRRRAR